MFFVGDVALPSSNYASRPVTPGQLKEPPNDAMEVALRLGDLADLTVSNEAGPLSVDVCLCFGCCCHSYLSSKITNPSLCSVACLFY